MREQSNIIYSCYVDMASLLIAIARLTKLRIGHVYYEKGSEQTSYNERDSRPSEKNQPVLE